jgi:S-methylmethionine-dependent homocysteine/selenocysteine methylase
MTTYKVIAAPFGSTIKCEKGIEGADMYFTSEGREAQRDVIRRNLDIGELVGISVSIFPANTYWASPLKAGEKYGEANDIAIGLLRQGIQDYTRSPIELVGSVGPKYCPFGENKVTSVDEAASYHIQQAQALKEAGIKKIWAETHNNPLEVYGLQEVARSLDMQLIVNVMLQRNGNVYNGVSLAQFMDKVPGLEEIGINCVGETGFLAGLETAEADGILKHIKRYYLNASDEDPEALNCTLELQGMKGAEYAELVLDVHERFDLLGDGDLVIGGCCGFTPEEIDALVRILHEEELF